MSQITPILSYLQDASKTGPMLLIEAPTTLGRTYQGYKRGGEVEGREKICEETLGAVVWLFGVQAFNKLGDIIGEKLLGLKDLDTDVGKDALRNPFGYVQDKKGLTAAFKFSKIVTSAALGTLAMGIAVPKIKMAMTNAIRIKAGLEPYPDKNSKDGKYHPGLIDKAIGLFIKPENKNSSLIYKPDMKEFISSVSSKPEEPRFKGNITNGLLFASHNLENNAAWRLMSTDFGTLAGRVANSRTKKEAIEYGFRDSISSLFYIFAAPLFSALLRKISNIPNVHPKGANAVCEKLIEVVKKSSEQTKSFSSKFNLSEENNLLFSSIKFSKEDTISLDEFNMQTLNKFSEKASLMSKLQPEYVKSDGSKISILSKKQVRDILSESDLSDPKFLKSAISDVTNGRSDDIKAFVSRKKLENIRDSFDNYVINLEKYAAKKGKDGVITEDIIKKYTKSLNRKNFAIHLAGVAFAAWGLAVLIPKSQYWISEKITGEKDFLGENELKPKISTTV